MGSPDFPQGRSPRARKELQLQGPRPSPLKINKDSHKIKKPPLPPSQPRPPVIIYTVSPKVIHTAPEHFKDLVQRLTGLRSSSSSSSSTSDDRQVSAPMSPAAHYATVEKANSDSPEKKKQRRFISGDGMEGIEMSQSYEGLDMENCPAGILSPAPTFLPQLPNFFPPPGPTILPPFPNFRNPPSDLGPLSGFFQDLSPILHQAGGGSFMGSPSNFISPYQHYNFPSPNPNPNPNPNNPSLDRDFFNNFPEFH